MKRSDLKMEILTVADILKFDPLSQGMLIAGAGGLANVVDSVSVLEVNLLKIPEGRVFAKGNAVDITSLYSVMDSVEDQVATIRLLKSNGNSALVLCHVGIVLKEVAPELISVCDELDYPLIVMPHNIGYREIIQLVSDVLRGLENKKLNNTVAMYNAITELLIKDQRPWTLVANLSRLIGCKTLYFNHNLKTEESPGLPEDQLAYIREQIRKNTLAFMESYEETLVPGYKNGPPLLLVPLYTNISYFGVVVIFKDHEFTDLEQMAILQTKNALSIANLNRTDVFEQHARLLSEYIDDLIHGYCENERVIQNRSVAIRHDISHMRAVIVVDIFEFEELTKDTDELEIQNLKRIFGEHMDSMMRSLSPASVGCNISDKYVILFSENIPREKLNERIEYLGKMIQRSVEDTLQLKVALGVGSFCDRLSEIKNSYEMALSAIHISNGLYRVPRISFCEDFPAYIFLLQNVRTQANQCRQLEAKMLRPLREYDKKNDASLVKTFRMLLKCDLDTNVVAKKMFLHKNTVLQRKKKITELYPKDPFELTSRLQFQCICLLNDLLKSDRNEESRDDYE